MKHKSNNFQFKNSEVDQIEIETLNIGLLMNTLAKHLTNCKVNKKVEKMAQVERDGNLIQTKVTIDMAVVTLKKNTILEYQSAMAFFTLLKNLLVTTKVWEYFVF